MSYLKKPYYVFTILILALWFWIMNHQDRWGEIFSHWEIMLTMVFGSFIAGASSEGGGAIAFPVMTLILDISPSTARNFSLAIQSIGMSAATLLIIQRKIPVIWSAIIYGSLGGIFGVVFSSICLTKVFSPLMLKTFFVSLWLSFGFVLYQVNRSDRWVISSEAYLINKTHKTILIIFGVLGGLVTGLIGNGIDIILFALLTLFFNFSEKMATPTSVILMTVNTIFGFLVHVFIIQDFQVDSIAYDYWMACIPVVIFGAPLGAWMISHLHRQVIYLFLISTIFIQFALAWVVFFLNNSISWNLIIFSVMVVSVGYGTFLMLRRKRVSISL